MAKRRSKGVTVTVLGPSGNQIAFLFIGGVIVGAAAIYFLPIVAPRIYTELDKASGGFLTNVNKSIRGGLKWLGLENFGK